MGKVRLVWLQLRCRGCRLVSFFVNPLPHVVFVHFERISDMTDESRNQHAVVPVVHLAGINMGLNLLVVLEDDDQGRIDFHIHRDFTSCPDRGLPRGLAKETWDRGADIILPPTAWRARWRA